MWEWLVVSGAPEERRRMTKRSFERFSFKSRKVFCQTWNSFAQFMDLENVVLWKQRKNF